MPFTKKIYSVSNGLPVDGINSMFYKSLDVTKARSRLRVHEDS